MPDRPPPDPHVKDNALRRWAGRHPVLAGFAGVTGVAFLIVNSKPPPPAPPEPPPPPPPDKTLPGHVPASFVAPFVAPLLKDASSAKYQDVTLRQRHGLDVFCGEVASKNSFGAYTGYQGFIVLSGVVQLQEGISARKWVTFWNGFCVDTDHDDAVRAAAKKAKGAHHARS